MMKPRLCNLRAIGRLRNTLGRACLSTNAPNSHRYGFIGLGKMGYPMAHNLRMKSSKDDILTVYDINVAATDQFSRELGGLGVEVAKDVNQVVEQSDTIITMLPEPKHVTSVFQSIVKSPPKPGNRRLFIDSSTIDITTSVAVNSLVSSSGGMNATFVDAPVSGGVVGATAGTLSFLVGCPDALFAQSSEVLSMMGSRIFHCGGSGTGLAAKLANNYLLAVTNIAVAEAMNLGMKLGLDKTVLKNVINSSSGRCWSSEVNNPVDNEPKGFEGGFGVALMKKDLALAREAAKQAGARLELDQKTEDVYRAVLEKEGSKDFSVVYKFLKG